MKFLMEVFLSLYPALFFLYNDPNNPIGITFIKHLCSVSAACMTVVPELVYISDKGKNQMRPFMYKDYLIMCFCIEESDT